MGGADFSDRSTLSALLFAPTPIEGRQLMFGVWADSATLAASCVSAPRCQYCWLHVGVAAGLRSSAMTATMVTAVMATMVSPVMSHAGGWGWGGVAVLRERDTAQAEQKNEREH